MTTGKGAKIKRESVKWSRKSKTKEKEKNGAHG
jgi:hypothetical protein